MHRLRRTGLRVSRFRQVSLIRCGIVHKARSRAQEAGHRVDARAQRRVHQMGIALRGLHLAVAEQLSDHFQRRATADQQGCEGMAQIMDAHVGKFGVLLDLGPEASDFPHWLADGLAGEKPRIAARHGLKAQPHDGRDILRDRHAMDLALLGGGGGFGPDGIVEVELIELRRGSAAET